MGIRSGGGVHCGRLLRCPHSYTHRLSEASLGISKVLLFTSS